MHWRIQWARLAWEIGSKDNYKDLAALEAAKELAQAMSNGTSTAAEEAPASAPVQAMTPRTSLHNKSSDGEHRRQGQGQQEQNGQDQQAKGISKTAASSIAEFLKVGELVDWKDQGGDITQIGQS